MNSAASTTLVLSLIAALATACAPRRAEERPKPAEAAALQAAPAPASPSEAAQTSGATGEPRYVAPDADGWGSVGELRFLELINGPGSRTQALPMVVLIHGMGDRPRKDWLQGFELDQPVRVIMPRAPIPHYQGFSWFDYDVHGNNRPEPLARGIARAVDLLIPLLDVVPTKRATTGLPLVAGFSQGGILAYGLAVRAPERLRIAVPIAGLLPEPAWPDEPPSGRRVPIRGLHGSSDAVVPTHGARKLTARLKELGYDITLEEFDGVGHTISPAMQRRINTLFAEALAP